MPLYQYKARDEAGKVVRGTMPALNEEVIGDKLKKMGYLATSIKEIPPGITVEGLFEKLKRVNYREVIMFNLQLAKMIHAGLPILTSLRILSEQTEDKKMKQVLSDVARSVEGGENFSGALERHPKVFSQLYVNMVKAGEGSGKLEEVLTRLAEYNEKQQELRQKIKTAITYPIVLIIVGILVSTFIVVFVLPKFIDIFVKANVPLPLPTLILHRISEFVRHDWYWAVLATIVVAVGIRQYIRIPKGRTQFDQLKLKLPLTGRLVRQLLISRFSRTLGTLLSSGVPILQSLEIVEQVIGNVILARVVRNVQESVSKGESVNGPLKVSGEFPPMPVQMIAVGEETGALDEMLNEIADFYDQATDYSVKRLTTLIEPIFLIIMGVMVGFIMASLLLPMFKMVRLIR